MKQIDYSEMKCISFDISEDLVKRFPNYKREWLIQKGIYEYFKKTRE